MMLKKLLYSAFALSISIPSAADTMRFVGFSDEEQAIVEDDMNWFWGHTPDENVFFRILGYEMEKGSGISMSNIQTFLYNHFPLVIAERQTLRRCPSTPSNCDPMQFSEWNEVSRSDQFLVQPHLKLYTPSLDKVHETTVFGFSPSKLLSVKNENQTMAVVNTRTLSETTSDDTDFQRWVRMSQWLALARLHQIFSSGGKGLGTCMTNTGKQYLCDPYSNGSLYIASLSLIAASDACDDCSKNERLMLKVLAFDHIVRTGRDKNTEKIVNYLRKELSLILEQDNEEVEILKRMLEKRNESTERGLSF